MSGQVRFGPFALNLETADLQGVDRTLRLPEQQFQILHMLLKRSGGVVTREEIRKRLWPNDTIVEFDRSINAAILKLRSALRDPSNENGFIETVARRGYRLLASVEPLRSSDAGNIRHPQPTPFAHRPGGLPLSRPRRPRRGWHGRGLQRRGRKAQSPRCPQVPHRGTGESDPRFCSGWSTRPAPPPR